MKRSYFPSRPGDPAPLAASIERRVRFEELDPLGIVWHGRYASYFEDAREALGRAYGLTYLDFHRHGLTAPIKRFEVDYARPLTYPQTVRIDCRLHYAEAARLNYEFRISTAAGEPATTGATVHLLLDAARELVVVQPPFLADFCRRWREGRLP